MGCNLLRRKIIEISARDESTLGLVRSGLCIVSQNKTKDMQPEQFMNIVDKFPSLFKHLGGLAEELQQL
jgi:hypothetical protein